MNADRHASTRRSRRIPGLRLALALALATPASGLAQIAKSPPPEGARTHQLIVGERYANGGLSRWFLGSGYRDLWTMPIELPVLNLDTLGGITPYGTGGYGQTLSLKFRSAAGIEYAVRSLDKEPTRRLDSLFTGTIVARIVQDQTAQFLPTAGLVVDPLLEATGILHPKHNLVIIPDDPRLGEFRAQFAGLPGMFTDDAQEGPDNTPGFAGSTRVSGSTNFLEELEEGDCNRADAREYLKARMVDMVIGDRDRHEGQFRWARFPDGPDCYLWRVVPEDRDQAFILNDGFMMSMYRLVRPQQVKFGPGWPSILGITFNGWELDRQLLVGLDQPVWEEVAAEVQAELTDDVIDRAVRRLPEPHYAAVGDFLSTSLKARRDRLAEQVLRYYRMISRQAEIKGTDRDELAVFEHLADGDLRVTVRYLDGPQSEAPWFERTFRDGLTSEVRIFLQGGDDVVEVRGARGGIKVRAIGGGGDDRLTNTSAAGGSNTRFYDARGDNVVEGAARYDQRRYERPLATNLVHRYGLDWGSVKRFLPALSYDSDIGLYLGLTAGFQQYGFRKAPWKSDNAFSFGMGTVGPEFFVGWDARYRNVIWGADLLFHANYSGLDVLRFVGFGNGTSFDQLPEFYQVEQRAIEFAPALEWNWGARGRREPEVDLQVFRPAVKVGLGPVIKYSDAPEEDNTQRLIGTLDPAPLGLGRFAQLGGQAWLTIDRTDRPAYPTSGFRIETGASAFPALLDADEAFGEVNGSVSLYLTPGGARRAPTLALRGGGKRVFGDFPFFESAFLGGSRNVRGLRSERFAGDAALFGNAEIRQPLTGLQLLFPADLGIHAAADIGRVYLDGDPDDADTWHTAVGGGFWLAFLNRSQVLSFTVMKGVEATRIYLRVGMHF